MTIALYILTAAVCLVVLELWALHAAITRLTAAHARTLDPISEFLHEQHAHNNHVAKILAIMCGLWPRANDVIVQQWADQAAARLHDDEIKKRQAGGR